MSVFVKVTSPLSKLQTYFDQKTKNCDGTVKSSFQAVAVANLLCTFPLTEAQKF